MKSFFDFIFFPFFSKKLFFILSASFSPFNAKIKNEEAIIKRNS
jgi:hypothetical protein